VLAAALALLLAAPPAPEDPDVKAGVAHYRAGEYAEARARLQEAIGKENLARNERLRAHVHLGFTEVAFGNRAAAKIEFKSALLLEPLLNLDPTQVSPKIIEVFEEARREMPKLPRPTPTPVVVRPTPRPSPTATPAPVKRIAPATAALQSAAVPGWGQLSEGRTAAAVTFAAAEVTAIGFLVWNQTQVGVAERNVKRAQPLQKDEMRAELRDFESYRNLSAAAVLAVTAAAATDAWLGARSMRRRSGPRVGAAPLDDGAMIGVSGRF